MAGTVTAEDRIVTAVRQELGVKVLGVCPVCENALGALPRGHVRHALCAWATPQDWAALAPFFTGSFVDLRGRRIIEASGV